MPEYIKPLVLCSSSIGSSTVADALAPLDILISLKPSLILSDSMPSPKQKQLNQLKNQLNSNDSKNKDWVMRGVRPAK